MKTLPVLILTCIAFCGFSQSPVTLKHTNFSEDSFIHLDWKPWLFNKSQSSECPPLDDSWQVLPGTDFSMHDKPAGWTGNGWFALWIKADEVLAGKKLAIHVNHDGASAIYIDGKPAGGYGKVATSANAMEAVRPRKALIPFWPGDTMPHLITVHYANFTGPYKDFIGFQVAIGDYDVAYKRIIFSNQCMNFILMTIGAYFILGGLFLFLYVFYPRQKLNMYYAAFVLLLGFTMLSIYFFYQGINPQTQFYAELGTYICKILIMWSGTVMLYAVGYTSIPRTRLVIVSVISAIYIILDLVLVFFFETYSWNDYFPFVFLLFIADGFISINQAKKRGLPNTALIATGIAATTLVFFFAWGDVFALWPRTQNSLRLLVIATGNFIFPACFSFYLALDFARTNNRLAHKLKEVEALHAKTLKQEAEKIELLSGEAKRLEATVAERTAEIQQQADKLKEMDIVKSRFFTNITHELKTPLTLILNPASAIAETSASAFIKNNATLIQNNAQRLLQLINQLLDLSKLENSIMELRPEPVELVQEVKEQLSLYQPLAMQKNISLCLNSDWLSLTVNIDKDKLRKIIHNLLSNAAKFTSNGVVEICLKALPGSQQGFVLQVKDTGIGITADKLPFIFERFYQANPHDARNHEGSGIGLALTKELVALMGGSINADSRESAYTIMTVKLPCTMVATLPAQNYYTIHFTATPGYEQATATVVMPAKPGRQQVLVVEDNEDLRNFICIMLGSTYNVLSAADGKTGVSMAQEQIPDLVITDIMMPGADGYWVCDTLKTDERTSHIPVVFLTAKSGTENRVKGIQTGADAYINKPFNQQELFATIDNLVAIRSLLQKKYGTSLSAPSDVSPLPSIEQGFISRVQSLVQEHLGDQQFGADQLAAFMALSRSQLHRKLKGLLDKSAGELIRTARMEQALYLLENKAAPVGDIAQMVGFSTPSAFTSSFSRWFGYPPSEVAMPGARTMGVEHN